MKVRLQDAGFGNIKVEESGGQGITLRGELRSQQELETVKAIANREAKVSGKAIAIAYNIDIRKPPGEPPGPPEPPISPVERKGPIAPGPKQF